jgi:hypothetical protein
MMRTQMLDSGLIVRQDFAAAVRPAFFHTAVKIDHTKANLHPFYAHIEEVHDRLRREVG